MYQVYERQGKAGKPIYYVAEWNESSGHYEAPAPKESGCHTQIGPLEYAGEQFTDRAKAQRRARYLNTA